MQKVCKGDVQKLGNKSYTERAQRDEHFWSHSSRCTINCYSKSNFSARQWVKYCQHSFLFNANLWPNCNGKSLELESKRLELSKLLTTGSLAHTEVLKQRHTRLVQSTWGNTVDGTKQIGLLFLNCCYPIAKQIRSEVLFTAKILH